MLNYFKDKSVVKIFKRIIIKYQLIKMLKNEDHEDQLKAKLKKMEDLKKIKE